jgi:small conductance mechanosensitive channel
MQDMTLSALVYFLGNKLLRILLILVFAAIASRFFNLVVERAFLAQSATKKFYLEEKRARTLSALLKSILHYLVKFIALLLILQEFQIDTTSILAGAGIIGLAAGIGAQGLVKDLISGFFIVLEDQYAVGDYIASGDMAGVVEEMGFRITKLRGYNGVLQIIPNGSLSRISNYTRGHMQAVINIPVAYGADVKKVLALLEQVAQETGKNMAEVLEGPKVLGVVDFQPGELIIRVVAKTVPLEQQKVETTFRLKVQELFAAEKIPAPISPVAVR